MFNLQLEFTKTLRNMEDHMGILLSLATFARIISAQNNSGIALNQGKIEPPVWLSNIQHFFGSKRGQKTLDLVALRVILACSSSSSTLTPYQAAESIRLAVTIIDNIDVGQKNAWVASGSSKITKLCDKVLRDGLDREIQLMVRITRPNESSCLSYIYFCSSRESPSYYLFVPWGIYPLKSAIWGFDFLFPETAEQP